MRVRRSLPSALRGRKSCHPAGENNVLGPSWVEASSGSGILSCRKLSEHSSGLDVLKPRESLSGYGPKTQAKTDRLFGGPRDCSERPVYALRLPGSRLMRGALRPLCELQEAWLPLAPVKRLGILLESPRSQSPSECEPKLTPRAVLQYQSPGSSV